MKCKHIQEVVESTQATYSAKDIKALKKQVKGKRPDELVSEQRIEMRGARLEEIESTFSSAAKERILGLNDLVDVNFLIRASKAAKAVGKIIIRDQNFREIGSATGFKVSPTLLLTNHHVFPDLATAKTSLIEFDFELDQQGNPKSTTRFKLQPDVFFMNNQELDYALVVIDTRPTFGPGQLSDYGFLRLNNKVGKINTGEFATIIQHPAGQPKQIALRDNKVLQIDEKQLLYESDTAQGSSGAPVFNDSWQVVALHHSGIPKKDENNNWLLKTGEPATPFDDDFDIDWIANAGIRASRIVNHVLQNASANTSKEEFFQASSGAILASTPPATTTLPQLASSNGQKVSQVHHQAPTTDSDTPNEKTLYVPVKISLAIGDIASPSPISPQKAKPELTVASAPSITSAFSIGSVEKMPFRDQNYENRKGYDSNFLGVEIPMPKPINKRNLSKMEDGEVVIPYEHFSIINNKKRKLALFTASNVDASPAKKQPEAGKIYTRAALGDMGPNDRETWFVDPRIPLEDQLSDQFYNRDRTAFDKGHIIRREDVNWGDSYAEVKKANGDTFHITNCSPQVKGFNRSNTRGIWGRMENDILKQARAEKYCIFSGPLLLDTDPVFKGINNRENIDVQIPTAYWKVIITQTPEGETQAFGFLLTQSLEKVEFEFEVNEEFIPYRISIQELENRTININFPRVIKEADQFAVLATEPQQVVEHPLVAMANGPC